MKILMVNVLYPPHRIGGAEKSVALLSESLVRAGDEVVVVTLDDIAEPTRSEERGIVVHRLPIDNICWPYGDVDAARSKLQRLRWHWNNRWNRRAAARVGELIGTERARRGPLPSDVGGPFSRLDRVLPRRVVALLGRGHQRGIHHLPAIGR